MLKAVAFLFLKLLPRKGVGEACGVFWCFKGLFSGRATEQPAQSQGPRAHKEEHPVSWDDSVMAEISLWPGVTACQRQLRSLAGLLHMFPCEPFVSNTPAFCASHRLQDQSVSQSVNKHTWVPITCGLHAGPGQFFTRQPRKRSRQGSRDKLLGLVQLLHLEQLGFSFLTKMEKTPPAFQPREAAPYEGGLGGKNLEFPGWLVGFWRPQTHNSQLPPPPWDPTS